MQCEICEEYKPEWISLKDYGLPDEGVAVLIYTKMGAIYTCRRPVIVSMNRQVDTELTTHDRVTHWMPLPPPPSTS